MSRWDRSAGRRTPTVGPCIGLTLATMLGCAPVGAQRRALEPAIREAIARACLSATARGGVARKAAAFFLGHLAADEATAQRLVACAQSGRLVPGTLSIQWAPLAYEDYGGSAPRLEIGGEEWRNQPPHPAAVPRAIEDELRRAASLGALGRNDGLENALVHAKLRPGVTADQLATFLGCCFDKGIFWVMLRCGTKGAYKVRLTQ